MQTYRGYLFAKLDRIGGKSEGPEYFLQQLEVKEKDIPVQKQAHLYEIDKELHQFLAHKVIISGTIKDEKIQYKKIEKFEPIPISMTSLYLYEGVKWGLDSQTAHSLSIQLKEMPDGEFTGHLLFDPNTCTLNPFGDRNGCTKMAPQSFSVRAVRLRIADPKGLGRYFYAMRAEGLPESTALIASEDFDSCYLKFDQQLIPLYPEGNVAIKGSIEIEESQA